MGEIYDIPRFPEPDLSRQEIKQPRRVFRRLGLYRRQMRDKMSWQTGTEVDDIPEFPSPETAHHADDGCKGWRTINEND